MALRPGFNWFAPTLGLSLLFASCATPPEEREVMRKEQVNRETTDEVLVGRGISAKLLGNFGAYQNDKPLFEYVVLVGTNIARQFGRPELEFRFGILDAKEVNAFAAPGGYIFVTKGLLKQVRTEDELAAVLAHEIAHINEKHMYKDIMPKREVSTSETIARMLSRGGSDISGSLTQIVSAGLKRLLEEGLSHDKEQAADNAAIYYASNAGYRPQALADFLGRLAAAQDPKEAARLSKTHPPFNKRITLINDFVRNQKITTAGHPDEKTLQQRFNSATTAVRMSK